MLTRASFPIDPTTILLTATAADQFFDGFEDRILHLRNGHVRYRIGGSGPAIVLLHGHPQTSAMWHHLAADLARDHMVICPDLRGYGRSWKPPVVDDHSAMSKREMASDIISLVDALGVEQFVLGAHDRGARVAHRLAADHPDRVRVLLPLDIAPTREMYARTDAAFAADYWWWFWLIQPAPMPERMISADPDWYWCRKCCKGPAGSGIFVRQALEEYLDCWRDPDTVASACEDYRAACSIDIAHDNAETSPLNVPVHALWGSKGAIERHFDCLALWRKRARHVSGQALEGAHFLAEEVPDAVIAEWRQVLAAL
ncbi:alpha/beta fold hydrolase [Litoreibacter roseus]|uniref:Alpha/beta hydrolase n=1 Tax=Litoreibacter roseus TaxID=2601869 RepID=A0A6N6JM47_9RHOB|nr:alpha/beta hydrolase [Litoreibacter roseus]GFE67047.1 alpha/beta hydrolase [Litoreibacter roseus]